MTGGMDVKGGVVTLPGGPGLGVEIDPGFLRKLEAVR